MTPSKLAVPAAGLVIFAGMASLAPAASGATSVIRPTVAYNFWRGTHWGPRPYGSVRPAVWGAKFGEPLQRLRWKYWRANSAAGHGRLVIMSCQPCYETLYFSVVRSSHGTRFFHQAKVSGRRTGTHYMHWNGRNWVNGR